MGATMYQIRQVNKGETGNKKYIIRFSGKEYKNPDMNHLI